jgi:hypothetical protein
MLQTGCVLLYYVLDALLILQPQTFYQKERTLHCMNCYFAFGVYLTDNSLSQTLS